MVVTVTPVDTNHVVAYQMGDVPICSGAAPGPISETFQGPESRTLFAVSCRSVDCTDDGCRSPLKRMALSITEMPYAQVVVNGVPIQISSSIQARLQENLADSLGISKYRVVALSPAPRRSADGVLIIKVLASSTEEAESLVVSLKALRLGSIVQLSGVQIDPNAFTSVNLQGSVPNGGGTIVLIPDDTPLPASDDDGIAPWVVIVIVIASVLVSVAVGSAGYVVFGVRPRPREDGRKK